MRAQHIYKPNQAKLGFLLTEKAVIVWRYTGQAFNKLLIVSQFSQKATIFKFFSAIYMSNIVEARSDQISESFSLWKRVQICSDFNQKLPVLKVFSASYMSVMIEARSFQSRLAYKKEFKIAPIFAKSYNIRRFL